MERKEEMRNESNVQEDQLKQADDNTSNDSENSGYDWKLTLLAIIMLLLMIWGAICLLLVPSLYYEIGNLKSQSVGSSELEKVGVTSKQIQEFSKYIDNINVSDGLSIEEFLDLEQKYLDFFMAEMINEDATSIYMEKKVVDKLTQALETTSDEKMQETIRTMLEGHEEVLESKEDELKEIEDMYTDVKNKEKSLEQFEAEEDNGDNI